MTFDSIFFWPFISTISTWQRIWSKIEKNNAEPQLTAILNNAMKEAELWFALQELQGQTFLTAKGLPFTFVIRGNELFVSRKDKSITRAMVNVAFQHITQLQSDGLHIDGPKKLGTFGASYLYPIFVMLGVIIRNHSDAVENDMISSDTCIST